MGFTSLGKKGRARKVLVCWFQSGGRTYAVVDGRAWQSDGARVEAVGRKRERRPVWVGEELTLAGAVHCREAGCTLQRLHVAAGGRIATHVVTVGAVQQPHVVAEHRETGGGARAYRGGPALGTYACNATAEWSALRSRCDAHAC